MFYFGNYFVNNHKFFCFVYFSLTPQPDHTDSTQPCQVDESVQDVRRAVSQSGGSSLTDTPVSSAVISTSTPATCDLTVSYDMGWQKRGRAHNSLTG